MISNRKKAEKIITELHSQFSRHLSSVLEDINCVKSIAEKSYGHLNGFSKIVLEDYVSEGMRVRLHIWKDAKEFSEEEIGDVHDHRWSYVSMPLFGQFIEDRYREHIDDKDITETNIKYRYKCYSRGVSEWLNLEGFEKVDLRKYKTYKREPGKMYFCKAGEIHTIRPILYPAATLVVTFDNQKSFARVYRNKIETEDFMKIYAPSFGIEEVKTAFTFVMQNHI